MITTTFIKQLFSISGAQHIFHISFLLWNKNFPQNILALTNMVYEVSVHVQIRIFLMLLAQFG